MGRSPAAPRSWRGFYAIIDPERCAGRDPRAVASAVLVGGCAVLQLRAKRLADRELVALARTLRELCAARGVPFVVNDRPDVAVMVEADALHLGQDDMPVAVARRVVGAMPIGLSTHDLAQATAAVEDGVDLIGFGPIFATATKESPDPVVGLERLGELCRTVPVPVVAIGGITVARAADTASAGASLVAAIAAVGEANDPAAAAAAMHSSAGGRA
jgi:thiamine-phosphate pyrophosphorylase